MDCGVRVGFWKFHLTLRMGLEMWCVELLFMGQFVLNAAVKHLQFLLEQTTAHVRSTLWQTEGERGGGRGNRRERRRGERGSVPILQF